jgi:uncharacterized membrane protein
MKNIFLINMLLVVLVSCKQSAPEQNQHDITGNTAETDQTKTAWKITGTEPFWNIAMHGDTVLYTRLNEKIDSITFSIHHFSSQDSVFEYHLLDTKEREGNLVIRRGSAPCSDGMSDQVYEYRAKLHYVQETLIGCAEKK